MEIAKTKNSLNVMEELLMKAIQGNADVPGDFNAIEALSNVKTLHSEISNNQEDAAKT